MKLFDDSKQILSAFSSTKAESAIAFISRYGDRCLKDVEERLEDDKAEGLALIRALLDTVPLDGPLLKLLVVSQMAFIRQWRSLIKDAAILATGHPGYQTDLNESKHVLEFLTLNTVKVFSVELYNETLPFSLEPPAQFEGLLLTVSVELVDDNVHTVLGNIYCGFDKVKNRKSKVKSVLDKLSEDPMTAVDETRDIVKAVNDNLPVVLNSGCSLTVGSITVTEITMTSRTISITVGDKPSNYVRLKRTTV